ncbi:hypothetical protein EDD11_004714 [Mortierella claussenii]|nr:hypothetical protein EDD11_004714 [Mortierella claussenii]
MVLHRLSEIILASILAQKENQARQNQHHASSTSPTTSAAIANPASRAITIVDPSSRTPLYIPPTPNSSHATAKAFNGGTASRTNGRYSGSTTPATAGLMAHSDSYFEIMPAMSRQQQQQQQLFNSMYGSHAYQFSPQIQQHQHQQAYSVSMTSPTMASYSPPRSANRIPIVNPDNGSIVSVPEAPMASPAWHQHQHHQHHFIAVR